MEKHLAKRQKVPVNILKLLRGTKDPYNRMSRLREQLPLSDYPDLVNALIFLGSQSFAYANSRQPRTAVHLRQERRLFTPVTLKAEIAWATPYLQHHASILNDFVPKARSFDRALLSGTADEAVEILDTIENVHGVSFWSIEARLAFLQFSKGLEAQKAYLTKVRELAENGTVKFVAYFLSERNEATTNPINFKTYMLESIPQWTDNPEFETYVLYRLADQWEQQPQSVAKILRWEFTSSIIDYYETYLKLATKALAEETKVAGYFLESLKYLASSVNDTRLRALLFLATADSKYLGSLPFQRTLPFELYAQGDVSAALREADTESSSVDPHATVLKIVASCQLGINAVEFDGTLRSRLCDLGLRIAAKLPGYEEAYVELLRLATNFQGCNFAACLASFAHFEMTPSPKPDHLLTLKAFINAGMVGPSILRALPPAQQKVVMREIATKETASTFLAAEEIRANLGESHSGIKPIAQSVLEEVTFDAAFDRADFDRIVISSRGNLAVNSKGELRRRWRLISHALLRIGEKKQATKFIAEKCVEDPECVRMMPIAECVRQFDEEFLAQNAGDLAIPVLFDLMTRHGEDHLTDLRYAHEDFLLSRGIEKPSDLASNHAGLRKDQLIYYLKHVCVPSVMHLSVAFDSSRALENERVAVCRLLKELDSKDASVYDAEIRELTRKQNIHRGLREVEQSKIWIDQEPLRRWAEKNLHENFLRYQALLAAGISPDPNTSNIGDSVTKQVEVSSSESHADLPIDEAANLLIKMFSQFITQCFRNRQHGLDSYLSLRIRHGALSGQMRAPLEAEKVITLRSEPSSGEYAANEHWLTRLSFLDIGMALRVDSRLRRFSQEYDGLIDSFNKDYVQIESEEKKHGLFTVAYDQAQLILMASDIHSGTTFDSFLDLCFQIFWDSVDVSLEAVREHVGHHLQKELDGLFMSLLADIDEITAKYPTPELDNAIRNARTRAGHALEQVKDWFRQSKRVTSRPLTFRHIVEISLEAVKNMYHDFQPSVQWELGDLPAFSQLQKLTDIFIIMFDNVRRHSGVGTQPEIEIWAGHVENTLLVEVRNEVAEEVIQDEENVARLEEIRSKIAEGAYHPAVSSEGGTGLMKISNIVASERNSRAKVEFGFHAPKSFYVRLELPVSIVAVDVGTIELEQPEKTI